MPAPTTTTTYLCGTTSGYGGIHAIAAPNAPHAVCGAPCQIAPRWGRYRAGLPAALNIPESLCTSCAWTVAFALGAQAAELAFWMHHGSNGPAGDLARRTATALLHSSHSTEDSADDAPMAVRLLATISAHWPVDLLPEDCVERECDHDYLAQCAAQGGSTACPTCSVRSGPEAGEWEGQYMVSAAAPCSALTAIAEHVNVPVEVA